MTVGRLYIKRKEKVKVKHDAQQIRQHNRKREKKNEHVQIQITVNDATESKENSPYRGNKVIPWKFSKLKPTTTKKTHGISEK